MPQVRGNKHPEQTVQKMYFQQILQFNTGLT